MRHLALSLALIGLFGVVAQPAAAAARADKAQKNIVEIAVGAGQFSTLVTAVKAAGLVDTLQGEGPFTVFAPTDKAFQALPDGALQNLIANKDQLKKVLLYHVVPGRVTSQQVVKLDSAKTAAGLTLPIRVEGGKVMIGNAQVVKADIAASNGVIHVINKVLLPPAGEKTSSTALELFIERIAADVAAETAQQVALAEKDIVATAVAAGSFKTLATALQKAGLVETLQGEGPFTVFAPTDEAFGKLPAGTLEKVLANKEKLTAILLYHVVKGEVTSDQVVKLDSATTVGGKKVAIKVKGGAVMINNAKVIKADIKTSNGVIHVIDTVLLP